MNHGTTFVLNEIARAHSNRASISVAYAVALLQVVEQDWAEINQAILARYERSGLEWIKERAHASVNAFRVAIDRAMDQARNPAPSAPPDYIPGVGKMVETIPVGADIATAKSADYEEAAKHCITHSDACPCRMYALLKRAEDAEARPDADKEGEEE